MSKSTKQDIALRRISAFGIVLLYCLNIIMMSSSRLFQLFNGFRFGIFYLIIVVLLLFTRTIKFPDYFKASIILIVYCFIAIRINHGGVNSAIQQVYVLALFLAIYNCKFSKDILKLVIAANTFVWLMWMINSKDYFSIFISGSAGESFNSNTVAQLLLFTYCINCVLSQRMFFNNIHVTLHDKPINVYKIIQFVLGIVTFIGITNCESRTSAVALLLFMALYFLPIKEILNQKRILIITTVIILGGIVWPIVYLSLQRVPAVSTFVYNLTGKSMYTGREWLWGHFFSYLGKDFSRWTFGLGQNTAYRMLRDLINIHNSYLAYLMFFGVVGLLLYIAFLYKSLLGICKYIDTPSRDFTINCIIILWIVLLTLYTETIVVWSSFLMVPYFMIALGNNQSMNEIYSEYIWI